jgi:anaerobic dimethyl sulfoxide reductase subunit C (anchor subunit)
LDTSWLSREILFGVLFLVFGALYAFLQWRKLGSATIRTVTAWVAALMGIGLVYSMARIYMLYSQPAWNTLATPVSFFVTTLLLGALAMGAAFVWNYARVQKTDPGCADVQCELMRTTLRWIAVASVVLLGIELVVLPVYLGFLALGNSAAQTSLQMMFSSFGFVFALRVVLVFVGAGILGLFLYQTASSAGQEKLLGGITYSAFVLVLAAEVMGRYLFYITHQGVGL